MMTTLFESMISCKTPRESNPNFLNKPRISLDAGKIQKQKNSHKSSRIIPTTTIQKVEEDIFQNTEAKQFFDKANYRIKEKLRVNESNDEKQYRILVTQYNDAIKRNIKQIPDINYTKLLNVIDIRIKEISNKELMNERVRKQIKGNFEQTHWNVDHIIKEVEDIHLLKQDTPLNKIQGFDELSSNEILENLRAKFATYNNNKKNLKSTRKHLGATRIQRQFQRRVNNCLQTIKQEYNVSLEKVYK